MEWAGLAGQTALARETKDERQLKQGTDSGYNLYLLSSLRGINACMSNLLSLVDV